MDSAVSRASDAARGYVLKAWKQKLIADNAVYLQQEVYGIENKTQVSSLRYQGLP